MPVSTETSPKKTSLYQGSTQYKHWRFSTAALASSRESQNVSAVAKIRDAFEQDIPGSSSSIAFLSAEEEHVLVKQYISKVSQLCAYFRFKEEVEASAVSYLKRFYLKNTVMDYHPKNVMLTAIFLAAKTSNCFLEIDQYVNSIPKVKAADVLDLEFLVAQSLRFEFTVWHAHRALWGMWLDAQTLPEFKQEDADEIYASALNQVRASRMTDVELIYSPSQIALACLHIVASPLAEEWARVKAPNESPNLLATIAKIQKIIENDSSPPAIEVVKDIDKRLKICTNPEKVVGSKAYLAKQAEVEEEAARKRAKKAEEVKEPIDPFAADGESSTTGLGLGLGLGVPGIPTKLQSEGLEPSPFSA